MPDYRASEVSDRIYGTGDYSNAVFTKLNAISKDMLTAEKEKTVDTYKKYGFAQGLEQFSASKELITKINQGLEDEAKLRRDRESDRKNEEDKTYSRFDDEELNRLIEHEGYNAVIAKETKLSNGGGDYGFYIDSNGYLTSGIGFTFEDPETGKQKYFPGKTFQDKKTAAEKWLAQNQNNELKLYGTDKKFRVSDLANSDVEQTKLILKESLYQREQKLKNLVDGWDDTPEATREFIRDIFYNGGYNPFGGTGKVAIGTRLLNNLSVWISQRKGNDTRQSYWQTKIDELGSGV